MDTQVLTTSLFIAVVALTVGITFWASRQTKTAADYYSGGRSFSGFQNGLAIGGDYMSAASFLGISGDRKSTRLNSSHSGESRMPSSA